MTRRGSRPVCVPACAALRSLAGSLNGARILSPRTRPAEPAKLRPMARGSEGGHRSAPRARRARHGTCARGLALALLCAAALACSGHPSQPALVVVLVVDQLRADRV